jgi:hypothetical protein
MKRVDAAALWDLVAAHEGRRKAYFFFGNQYCRWDIRADCEDAGYPKKISEGWKGIWKDGFDAVVVWPLKVKDSDRGGFRRKAYFFKGLSYLRWDIRAEAIDGEAQSIPDNWKKWPDGWTKVDAVVAYSDFRLFFFSGPEYAHFEVDKNQFTWVRKIADHWPQLPSSGIDAAVNWPVRRRLSSNPLLPPAGTPVWPLDLRSGYDGITDYGKAYFFFGNQYVRYDIDKDAPDDGYPHVIERWWRARSFAVFAALADVPPNPAEDARLHDEKGNLVTGMPYPEGLPRGQAGWDLGLTITGIDALPALLKGRKLPPWLGGEKKIPHGAVNRLGICAHGRGGFVRLYAADLTVALTPRALKAGSSKVKDDLLALEPWLAPDATVLFMSCRAGGTGDGHLLLRQLSELWPGRKVVGFWTVGYIFETRMYRKGLFGRNTDAHEPGMRSTNNEGDAASMKGTKAYEDLEQEVKSRWNDLDAYPWASETSPHARVALNGTMIVDTYAAKGGWLGPPTPDP